MLFTQHYNEKKYRFSKVQGKADRKMSQISQLTLITNVPATSLRMPRSQPVPMLRVGKLCHKLHHHAMLLASRDSINHDTVSEIEKNFPLLRMASCFF